MLKNFLFFMCVGYCSMEICGQVSNVNPVPQQVSEENTIIRIPAKYKIISGVQNEKAVRSFRKNVPQKSEGYYLKIDSKRAIVVGYDSKGLKYGKMTLQQIMRDSLIQICEIKDWPDVSFRGVVEGFYGTPWSHESRLRQLDFYGQNKLNVYFYGPKDDPYHSTPNWRLPYPTKEGIQIQELVKRAKQNGVNFYWAIHPGGDIKWNETDRDLLLAKFESMYQLGVRAFAIFFDDISGEGTKAERQAELLNFLDDNFVQKKKDISPLVVCPTEYNRAWVNEKKGYLKTLGEKLNKNVQIMWTGNTVVHCIDKESMEWINNRIGRNAYIWWNFPVTDYCRDHLMLGPVYGNGKDISEYMSGFVSNPMEHAEASKIALYGIADYTWNMRAFDSTKNWERAIQMLLPNNAKALEIFASYNEDAGPNGHRFRRDESIKLKEELDATKSEDDRVKILRTACDDLGCSVNALLFDKKNASLIEELRPWLLQGKLVAEYGQTIYKMKDHIDDANDKNSLFDIYYKATRSLQRQMYELENSSVRHPLQPGIKVASKVLLPELNQLFSNIVSLYNERHDRQYDVLAEYVPFKLNSDVSQLSNQPIVIKENKVYVKPALEVIKWGIGDYLAIYSEKSIHLDEIEVDFDTPTIDQIFEVEILQGKSWKKITLSKKGNTLFNLSDTAKNLLIDAVRIVNNTGKEVSVKMKTFKISFQ